MSARQRGRGRGDRNPLASPFQSHNFPSQQSSPADTHMTDDQVSLVNPAPGSNFSDDEESAFSSPRPPPTSETNQLSYQELTT
ncbi:hypothetical protein L873DRAFT_146865 [Choiromyces venosus 120613-1]|uniref:Uncharacterized protein n=1 Tax=Choiromyces venosus 120613-1 TaxID=1336337 RepID=A0A3N4J3M4_9PEZI|nr:hypothetical protein L873DRAFT_146865 [Choiromyces venosus 120613-1]